MTTIGEVLGRDPEPLPEWLDGDGPPPFDRGAFLSSRTVYYPGSGEDGQPVELCNRSRAAHCFVYVDQDDTYREDAFREKLGGAGRKLPEYERRFYGYGLASWEPVPMNVPGPGGWTPTCGESGRMGLDLRYFGGQPVGGTFAFFAVMDRRDGFGDDHGARRFAILFIGGDGFAFYDALYCQGDGTPPPFLAVIQDHGFGGNWPGKCFGASRPERDGQLPKDGLLERIARKSDVLPEFLLVGRGGGTEPWADYADTGAVPERGGMHESSTRSLFRRQDGRCDRIP